MFNRIIVPLDGSDLASEALAQAKELASRLGVELHLVRAIDPTVLNRVGAVGMGFDYSAVDQLLIEEEKDATSFIETQVASLRDGGFKASGVVLRGYAASAILSASAEGDLIVMASHGRTGVRRWFLGSVAEEVLRQSTVPIMLIRQHEPESKS